MSIPSTETIRAVLRAVCVDGAANRVAISHLSGIARSTVSSTVEFLIDEGMLVEQGAHGGGRGRPARELELGPGAPIAGIFSFRPGATTVAISDLRGTIRARGVIPNPLSTGPEEAVDAAALELDRLMDEISALNRVELVVASIGAKVNGRAGSVVRSNTPSGPTAFPSIGWEDFPIGSYVSRVLGAPAVLENDVHLLAIGDGIGTSRDRLPLVRLHASIGLGAGILDAGGRLFRGVGGLAGDVGHLVIDNRSDHLCWCGKRGCISQTATIYSIGRDLGLPKPEDDQRLVGLLSDAIADHDEVALQRVRDAADAVGRVAAVLVDTLNPGRLVLSGELMHLCSDVLARVRAAVFEHSLPLSSRHLDITVVTNDDDSTLPGAARSAADRMLSMSGTLLPRRASRPATN